MPSGQNEDFFCVLKDKAFEFDWNLLNPKHVRFEIRIKDGRADYFLNGERGSLIVAETKSAFVSQTLLAACLL